MRALTDISCFLAALCLTWTLGSTPAAAQGGVRDMKCESATNPRGVLTAHPTLSWGAVNPTQVQRGYQILVASSEEKLKADDADLWDTGLVRSAQKAAKYQGKPLSSNQRCYWKIRIWENYFQNGSYSEPATWEMGVLSFDNPK